MTSRPDELAHNRETVSGYDACAESYAAETDHEPTSDHLEALGRFVAAVGHGGRALEIASGPGWDADRLEAMGLDVRRTDLSEGFIAFQRKRGRKVHPLDLIEGDLGGPWDGLIALYVIQHIGRNLVEGVIGRIAEALRSGGILLLSFQLGEEERFSEHPEATYQVVQWTETDMSALLVRHGLTIDWRSTFEGREGVWLTVIARRTT